MFGDIILEATKKIDSVKYFLPDEDGKIQAFEETFKDDEIRKKVAYMFSSSHEYDTDEKKAIAVKSAIKFVNNYNWEEKVIPTDMIENFNKPVDGEKTFDIARKIRENGNKIDFPLIVVNRIHGFAFQTGGMKDEKVILLDGNGRLSGIRLINIPKTPVYFGTYTGAAEKPVEEFVPGDPGEIDMIEAAKDENFTIKNLVLECQLTEVDTQFLHEAVVLKKKKKKQKSPVDQSIYDIIDYDKIEKEHEFEFTDTSYGSFSVLVDVIVINKGLEPQIKQLTSLSDEDRKEKADKFTKTILDELKNITSKFKDYPILKYGIPRDNYNYCILVLTNKNGKTITVKYPDMEVLKETTINTDWIPKERIILEAAKKNKIERVPLTNSEKEQLENKLGMPYDKIGCNIAKDAKTGKYFAYTHRVRSKFYDKVTDIPVSAIRFVSSTS